MKGIMLESVTGYTEIFIYIKDKDKYALSQNAGYIKLNKDDTVTLSGSTGTYILTRV